MASSLPSGASAGYAEWHRSASPWRRRAPARTGDVLTVPLRASLDPDEAVAEVFADGVVADAPVDAVGDGVLEIGVKERPVAAVQDGLGERRDYGAGESVTSTRSWGVDGL